MGCLKGLLKLVFYLIVTIIISFIFGLAAGLIVLVAMVIIGSIFRSRRKRNTPSRIRWLGQDFNYLTHVKGIPELESNEPITFYFDYKKILINGKISIPMDRIKRAKFYQKSQGSYRYAPSYILLINYISVNGKDTNAQFKYNNVLPIKYFSEIADFINEQVGYKEPDTHEV